MAIDRQKSPLTARRSSRNPEVTKNEGSDRSVSDTDGSSHSWGKNSASSRSSRSGSNNISKPSKSCIKTDSKQSNGHKKVSFSREIATIPHISHADFSEEEHKSTFVSAEELKQTKSKALLIADIVLETEVSDMDHSTRGLERIMYADQKLILRDQAYAAVLSDEPDIEMYKAFSLLSICEALRAAEKDEEFARRYQSGKKGTKSSSGDGRQTSALWTLTEDGEGRRHSSHSRSTNKELDAVAMFLSSPHGLRKKLMLSGSRTSSIPVSIKVPTDSGSDECSEITTPTVMKRAHVKKTPVERKQMRSPRTPQPIAEVTSPGPSVGRKVVVGWEAPVRRRSNRVVQQGQVPVQVKAPPPPLSPTPMESPRSKNRSKNSSNWAKQLRSSLGTRGRSRSNSGGARADQDDTGPKGLVSPRRMRSKSPNWQKEHREKSKPELVRTNSDPALGRSKFRSAKEPQTERKRSKSPSWRKRFQRKMSFTHQP